jgi:hypothetical protein
MSLSKIILIVVVAGIVLFVLLLTYTLWPTIRNISDDPLLVSFVDKPLSLKSRAFIYTEHKGNYRFFENTLTQESYVEDKLKYDLPVGSVITIRKFKTYKSNAGSGSTDVFALGEFTAPNGSKIEFEYVWGNIDPSLYSRIVSDLPIAPWQDSTALRIHIEK